MPWKSGATCISGREIQSSPRSQAYEQEMGATKSTGRRRSLSCVAAPLPRGGFQLRMGRGPYWHSGRLVHVSLLGPGFVLSISEATPDLLMHGSGLRVKYYEQEERESRLQFERVDMKRNKKMRVACATGSTPFVWHLHLSRGQKGAKKTLEISYPNSTVHCHPSFFEC